MQLGDYWLGDQTADVAAVPGDLLDQVELRNEYSGLVVMSRVSPLASR
jgi:hypothetical protein